MPQGLYYDMYLLIQLFKPLNEHITIFPFRKVEGCKRTFLESLGLKSFIINSFPECNFTSLEHCQVLFSTSSTI